VLLHKRHDRYLPLWLGLLSFPALPACAFGPVRTTDSPAGAGTRQARHATARHPPEGTRSGIRGPTALNARRAGELSGADFRSELTNLMRWRLERDLGYKTTLVFKVTNTIGSEIFDMIFATDHWAGEKIMKDVYSAAERRQPGLRRKAQLQRLQAREERHGRYGMFDLDELAPHKPDDSLFEVKSEQLPPHPPYRRPGRR
jgi:hypothetical protein